MPDWRYGFLASLGFTQMEPAQVAGSLAELGYGAVEWTLAHFNPRTMSPAELASVVDAARKAGLESSELVVQQDLVHLDEDVREDRIRLTQECIQAAGDAGIPVINAFTGPAPWDPGAPRLGADISQGGAWRLVREAFERILPVAEQAGVTVAVEAVWGMLARDCYTLQELFRQVDSPRLAVNMDPSHMALYRNDIGWAVEQLGPRIAHVHLKDAVGLDTGQEGDFIFPLLGEGLIDWPGFFTALEATGYDGVCSVEFESFKYYNTVLGGDPVAAARLSMEQIQALAQE